MAMIYFDNAATTAVSVRVQEAVHMVMADCYGNPSSLHQMGLAAEHVIKDADKTVSALLGVTKGSLFWTSGGTESNNLAILGAARAMAGRGRRVVTSAVEHPSVAASFEQLAQEGFDVIVLPVGADGRVDPAALAEVVDHKTTLVSIMHVNNETGVVQDIESLCKAAKEKHDGLLFHCDAVQSFGKHTIYLNRWGIDLLSASAHKIHGLKGTGFLYARNPVLLKPLIHGGGQQNGVRPGTENVIGIAAMGAAAADAFAAMDENMKRVSAVKEWLMQVQERIENVMLNGAADGSPYIVNFSFQGVRAEVLLHALESEGICVSAGSACSAKQKYSQVLVNHGLSVKRAEEAIRISLCAENTVDEAALLIAALQKQIPFLRRFGGVRR